MKRTAIAVVLGSTLAVLAAGSAFAQAIDEAGIRLPAQVTYADSHRASGVIAAAFPGAVDESGIRLPSASTYADQHRAELDNMAKSAFPQGIDEAGHNLPPMPVFLGAEEPAGN